MNNKKIITNVLTALLWCYIAYMLFRIVGAVFQTADYPNEYREAANIAMTNAILEGTNIYNPIYASGNTPTVCYLYGPLMSLLAALFKRVLPFAAIQDIHYGISFASMLLSAYMLADMVYRERKNLLAASAAFWLGLICHWRYGYIYAAPDSFGLCLMIAVIYVLSRCRRDVERSLFCPQLAAFLAVLTFFTKQYFVVVALTGALYLLFVSKRQFVRYAFSGILFSAIFYVGLSYFAPLYFTYALYFLKGPGAGAAMGKTGIAYNTMQVSYLGGMLLTLFLAAAAFTAYIVYKVVKGQKLKADFKNYNEPLFRFEKGSLNISFYILFYVQLLVAAVILKYIGNNDGAFLSYYLQLFVPALIVIAVCAVDSVKIPGRYGLAVCCILYLIFAGYTIYKVEPRLIINRLSENEMENWHRAYDIAEKYSGEKNDAVYYTPPMNYKGYEMNQLIYNDGQPFVFTEKFMKAYKESSIAQKLYPYAGSIISQHLRYREGMRQRVLDGEYELVMYIDGQDPVFTREELEINYAFMEMIPLRTGNWAWDVEFWIKKVDF